MKLQLVSENEEFEYKYGESTVWIRRLEYHKLMEFRAKATAEVQALIKAGEIDIMDAGREIQRRENEMTIDYCVRRWDKVVFPGEEKDAVCNFENKLRLPGDAKTGILSKVNLNSIEEKKKGS